MVEPVRLERAPCMFNREVVVPPAAVDPRKLEERGTFQRLVPNRLVESVIRLVVIPLKSKREPEVVIGLAIVRIGVANRDPGNGAPEMGFRLAKHAAAKQKQPHGVVASAFSRVPSQRLFIVEFGLPRRMSVLLQMQSDEKQFLH